jgi:hypothetical protein
VAEAIAADWWSRDPWLCQALLWEAYALQMPAEAAVSAVSTGVQSVSYSQPGSRWALAMARAEWFRSQRGSLFSVPLEVGPPGVGVPVDWWERDLEHPWD